jgi:hypothetical protein
MTTNENNKPLYRVTFARVVETDAEGHDKLGRAREIGAVWPRKGDKKGAILALDIIPFELALRKGAIFLVPVGDDTDNGE